MTVLSHLAEGAGKDTDTLEIGDNMTMAVSRILAVQPAAGQGRCYLSSTNWGTAFTAQIAKLKSRFPWLWVSPVKSNTVECACTAALKSTEWRLSGKRHRLPGLMTRASSTPVTLMTDRSNPWTLSSDLFTHTMVYSDTHIHTLNRQM